MCLSLVSSRRSITHHVHFPNRYGSNLESQRSEEPSVLSALISFFQRLLYVLLCILPLGDLLESVVRDDVLQTFEFECVSGGHDVVVVYHLNEWLDLGSLLDLLLSHPSGDL